MKKLVAFIMVLILIFSMCACNNTQLPDDDNKQTQSENNQQTQNNNLSQPITNLEFWIAENVDDVDFSKYQIRKNPVY